MGGDCPRRKFFLNAREFQFPPPRGGRPKSDTLVDVTVIFQFPPPRGGRLLMKHLFELYGLISIPAPAWGATLPVLLRAFAAGFQFPPPRGGRRVASSMKIQSYSYFNSRPRVGGDGLILAAFCLRERISIPAPAWGATRSAASCAGAPSFQFPPPRGGRRSRPGRRSSSAHFNSRPRVGGDYPRRCRSRSQLLFQFPPPRGGRPADARATVISSSYFNSRPRVGGDPDQFPYGFLLSISIPAPAWGATAKIDKKACGFCCKFTKFALRLFKKQEDFYWKSSFCPKRRTFFLTFPAPIARRLVYGWHRRRKTRGYRSKGSPDWIGAVFPSASILFL